MERVISACGATPVRWNMAVECCGGAFSLSRTASVVRLGRAIVADARRAGADAIVVACPMCHCNLDFRQAGRRGGGLPVLFITQLVGLALGLPRRARSASSLHRHRAAARSPRRRSAAGGGASAQQGQGRGESRGQTAARDHGRRRRRLMARIGVFVCHCGENIGRTVDCARVAETLRRACPASPTPSTTSTCAPIPASSSIKQAIEEHELTGVVVAACSPHMHEKTFRRAAAQAGLNPFLCEMANIREHCSWIHEDREEATVKAIDLAPLHRREGQAQRAARDDPHPGDASARW